MNLKDNYRLSSYVCAMDTENSKTGAVSPRTCEKGDGSSGSGQRGQAPGHFANEDHARKQGESGYIEPVADIKTGTQNVNTRNSERRRALKTGKIEINLDYANIPCLVRDISKTGAKIKVTGENLVPDNFILHIPMDGFSVDCHVIRRSATDFGVEFVGEKRKLVNKKVQYIRAASDRTNEIAQMNYASTGDQDGQAATIRPVNSSTQKANKPAFGRRGG